MAIVYCSRLDIVSIIGEAAVLACIDDDQDGVESPLESSFVDHAIERAAVEMSIYLRQQYDLLDIANNTWCKWCNAYLAAWNLFTRRGNPPPDTLVQIVDKYREELKDIKNGLMQLPEQNSSFEYIPTVSNLQPELGKLVMPVRVDVQESTGSSPAPGRMRHVAKQPGFW
jgi:hypothetical protein